MRVKSWRLVTVPVTAVWAASSLRLVVDSATASASAPAWVFWLWIASSVYFAALSLVRSLRR